MVICQLLSPLLLPPKRHFFGVFAIKINNKNKANLHIGETDGRQGENESAIKNHTVNRGCHGNQELEAFFSFFGVGGFDSPERPWRSLGHTQSFTSADFFFFFFSYLLNFSVSCHARWNVS